MEKQKEKQEEKLKENQKEKQIKRLAGKLPEKRAENSTGKENSKHTNISEGHQGHITKGKAGEKEAPENPEASENVTYLLQCADGTLYCGWTNHLDKRVKAHNQGKGAKYTRSRRPVTLVYYEIFATKREAMSREAAIKKLSRQEKLALAAEGSNAGHKVSPAGFP